MAKHILILGLSIALILTASATTMAFDLTDWFKHCNLSGDIVANMSVSSTPFSDNLSIQDDFDDIYTFQISQTASSGPALTGAFSLSIPVYYNQKISAGLTGDYVFLSPEMFPETQLARQWFGLYLDYTVTDHLKLHGTVGKISYNLSANLDYVEEAYPDDPGPYINGNFYSPGTPLKLSGSSEEGLSWSIGAKYYVMPWLFVQGGYYYYPDAVISGYQYTLGDLTVITENKPNPVTIKGDSVIRLGVGVGF